MKISREQPLYRSLVIRFFFFLEGKCDNPVSVESLNLRGGSVTIDMSAEIGSLDCCEEVFAFSLDGDVSSIKTQFSHFFCVRV